MDVTDSVKIVVVGDSGVGKTSLVNLICYSEIIRHPGCTIGCSPDIYLHEYKAGTPSEKTHFIELWDIGGSTSHKNSRSIFYNNIHGVVLVHDLSNRKSLLNLPKWLAEVLNKDHFQDISDYDPEQFAGNQIPVMIIGTHIEAADKDALVRTSRLAEECGADDLLLDCHHVKSLAPGSTNAVKLSKFLDKVIERRYYSRDVNQGYPTVSSGFGNSRRLYGHSPFTPITSPHNKSSHVD